jgi:hypothetical protein
LLTLRAAPRLSVIHRRVSPSGNADPECIRSWRDMISAKWEEWTNPDVPHFLEKKRGSESSSRGWRKPPRSSTPEASEVKTETPDRDWGSPWFHRWISTNGFAP